MKIALKLLISCGIISSLAAGCTLEEVLKPVSDDGNTTSSTAITQRFAEQEALATIGTNSVAVVREMGIMYQIIPVISTQIQRILNDIHFNVKNSGLPNWTFDKGVYTLVTTRDTKVTMQFSTHNGTPHVWDVLNSISYPSLAKTFPTDINGYVVQIEKTNFLNTNGAVLKASLTGRLPTQVPLVGDFTTSFTGNGSINSHPTLSGQTFSVSGNSNLQSTIFDGQFSFESMFNKTSYTGTGTFNQNGFGQLTPIQQNGVTVGEIRQNGTRWDIVINGQVIATSG